MQVLCRQGRQNRRQLDPERRSTFLPVVAVNSAAVLLHNAEANAKTQAGAFADWLCRIKRIEDAVRLLDTGPGIQEKHYNVSAVAHCLDREDAALRSFHGVDRIADQIKKYLHQLVAIAANSGENGLELKFDTDGPSAEIESAKLHGVGYHSIDVEERSFRGDLPRKTKEISHQSFGSASLVANLRRRAAGLLGKRSVVGQEIGEAKNGCQRVVDFMSGAGR